MISDPVGGSFSKNALGNLVEYVVCVIIYFYSFLFVNPYTTKWRLENKICEESLVMATSLAAITAAIQVAENDIEILKSSNSPDALESNPLIAANLHNLEETRHALVFLKTNYRSTGHVEDLTEAIKNVSSKIVKNCNVVANLRDVTRSIMVGQIMQNRGVPTTFNTVSDTLEEMGLKHGV